MDKEHAIALIHKSGLSPHSEMLIENLLPSVRISVDRDLLDSNDASIPSFFGGSPQLPNDVKWPTRDGREHAKAKIARLEEKFRKNPRATGLRDIATKMRAHLPTGPTPLAFLGQIDLAELATYASLDCWPTEGSLAFFYESGWGFDPLERGNCRVLHFPAGISLANADPPTDLHEQRRSPKHGLSLRREWTLPNHPRSDWSEDEYEALKRELRTDIWEEGPVHRIGGHPEPIQSSMELECQLVTNGIYCGDSSGYKDPRVAKLEAGAADWRLLIQIDSDKKLGWMWGDSGRVYFWTRWQKIKAQDFEGVWTILQCY